MTEDTRARFGTFLTQKLAGTVLMALGLIGLVGWVNSIEPDCYYSTKVGLQIRLCGENYVDREESANLWVPAVFFVVLLGGVLLRVRARKSETKQSVFDAD